MNFEDVADAIADLARAIPNATEMGVLMALADAGLIGEEDTGQIVLELLGR